MGRMLRSATSHEANHLIVTNARLCELDRLIEQALATVRQAGRERDILFARTTGRDGLHVLADPEKGAWMIAAGLANAIDRSPYRGVVTLDIRPGEAEIGLAISDQGLRSYIAGSTKGPQRGQSRFIAFEFDGTTTCHPAEDDGATFILTFTSP